MAINDINDDFNLKINFFFNTVMMPYSSEYFHSDELTFSDLNMFVRENFALRRKNIYFSISF